MRWELIGANNYSWRRSKELLLNVLIIQPRSGYRFSEDSLKLAEFANITPSETLLDIGCGAATLPLLIWCRQPFRHAVGVELDAELAELARLNITNHGLATNIFIVHSDIRSLYPAAIQKEFPGAEARFDVIVSNPPFWRLSQGRLGTHLQKARAKHEMFLKLRQLLTACARFIAPGGRVYLCHLQSRESEIYREFESARFGICRSHILPGRNPRVLIEASARSLL